MTPFGTLILQLIQNASLLALLVVGYAAVKRRRPSQPAETFMLGLLFGMSGIAAMALSINLSLHVQVSAHGIPIGLAAFAAGPVVAVIAVAMTAAYRFWEGSDGALASMLAMIATAGFGLAARQLRRRWKVEHANPLLLCLGVASAFTGSAIFALLGLTPFPVLLESMIPLLAVVPAGMALTGLALHQADAQLALQARLSAQTTLLDAVFHSMSDGVTVANEKGEIVMVNPASMTLAGVPTSNTAAEGSSARLGVFQPDGTTPFPAEQLPLVRALSGEVTNDIEIVVEDGEGGRRRRLSVNGRPLIGRDGTRHGAVTVCHDITTQKGLKRALRQSEERFAMAVTGSRDGLYDYNPVSGEAWFSPRYKEILGYTNIEFVDDIKFWNSRMLPEDRAATAAKFRDYEAGLCPDLDIVQRFRHKDGHIVHLSSRAQGQRGPDGKVVRLTGAVTDITPLLQSQQRLKDAISVMVDGFGLFDAQDRLLLYNKAFLDDGSRKAFGADLTGRRFEEIARAFAEHHMPEGADREAWIVARMERHRNPPNEAIEVQWSDERWMRISERRTSDGGYVGIWTDVTALKAAEARLRDAIESINEGFALFDQDHRYVAFNKRLLDLYPISAPAVFVGAKLEDVLRYGARHGEYTDVSTEAEIETFVGEWMKRFESPEPFTGEGRFGDGRWVLVSHRRTASGGYVTVRTDISAQKHREHELTLTKKRLEDQARQGVTQATNLRQARLRADRANQEKSRFLAGMSHELRTPLNAIIGFSDLIRQQIYGPVEPASYLEYAELIHQSGHHLLSLINDVLDLSKIEAGKMEIDQVELESGALLKDVARLISGLAHERAVTVVTAIQGGATTLWADPRSIKQILLNLLSNAVKFTPSGGRISATVENAGDETRITISDTGIGMNADELQKALLPYGQVRADVARPNVGTGLGLPLAKSLTELHGGRLEIQSSKGKGTTVVVRLPKPIARADLQTVAREQAEL